MTEKKFREIKDGEIAYVLLPLRSVKKNLKDFVYVIEKYEINKVSEKDIEEVTKGIKKILKKKKKK
jgi:lipoate-protein ligase B